MKNLLLLFFILLSTLSFSQKTSIKMTKEFEEDNLRFAGLLHSTDEHHYVYFTPSANLLSKKHTYRIKKFDKQFKEIYSKEFIIEKNRISTPNEMKYFNNQFVLLSFKKENNNSKNVYNILTVNLDGEVVNKKNLLTHQLPKKGIVVGYVRDWDYDYKINDDKTQLLLMAPKSIKKELELEFLVVDNNLETVWNKKIKMPYEPDRIEIESIEFGDKNSAYMIAKVYDEKSGMGKLFVSNKKLDYKLVLFKISADKEVQEINLGIKNKFIKNIALLDHQSENELVLLGFTGDTRRGPISGMVNLKLNKQTGETIYAKSKIFSQKELEKFGKKNLEKDRKTKERGLRNSYVIKNVLYKEDGSMLVSAYDNYYAILEFNNSYNTKFEDKNIVLINIDPSGKIDRLKLIPRFNVKVKGGTPIKRIFEKTTHYMYYIPFYTADNTYFIYNEDKRNFDRPLTDIKRYKKLMSFENAITVISHYNDKNKLVKKKLLAAKDIKSAVAPKFCKQISENEMFFYTYKLNLLKKNTYNFGILTLE